MDASRTVRLLDICQDWKSAANGNQEEVLSTGKVE